LGEEHIADEVKQLAISLAVFTYQQISFLLSATTTVVGLVALTISTELPWRCVFGVATVLAVILILWWYFYWQSLTFDDLHGSKGKSMQLWGWALPIIAWILTIIAQAAVGDGQPVV